MRSEGTNRIRKSPERLLAYVGTYSSPVIPKGFRGNGQGIYLLAVNPKTGTLTRRQVFQDFSSPSWLAMNPAKTHLYAANEMAAFEGTACGTISSYRIEPSNGSLSLINTVGSGGAGPAYLSIHPSGRFAFVANYEGGTIAVFPIGPSGELCSASDIKPGSGQVGAALPSSAPPGSFAISGHDRHHPHMIRSDASGRFVLSADVGADGIFIWKFDLVRGRLSPARKARVKFPNGDGPRHFTFHPNGRWLYSLQEEGSTLVLFDYDEKRGSLKARQTVSSLPKNFEGTSLASEVMISSNGKFLYAANRLHNSIACFSIGAMGRLRFEGETWTRGDYPRSFNIDATGRYLYCCNQRSDAITSFKIDRGTGRLTFAGQYFALGTPSMIVFLDR
jgi:6-phosphogluconolactonase